MSRQYATQAQLQDWLGASVALPVDPDVKLQRASDEVDYALNGAVYAVDNNSLPTDLSIIAALQDATTAQVEYWMVTNDEVGQFEFAHMINSTDAGLQIQRLPGRLPALCRRSREILVSAGLLSHIGVAV